MDSIIQFFIDNKYQLIIFAIAYLPTIIFILTVVLSIIISALRGIRKTYIFLLHSLIAFIICLVLFFLLVEVKEVDMFILYFVNKMLPEGKSMQNIMEVSESCNSFREIFLEYIPNQLNEMDGIALIARENGKYLNSLVDVAYRFLFGSILYVVFFVLKFIMWIIYIIFFNERKYAKKRERLYENGLVDEPYKKKRILSGFIGLGRGLLAATISISFIGSFYYIFAGGIGNKQREKIEFENEYVNFGYDAYSELESYGTKGIFKVLNILRDENDMPYYLFAANMIYQGKLTNPNGTENVYLIDELKTLVDFSRNTFDLFLKYDKDNIVELINSEQEFDVMSEIIKVFEKEEFQNEFDSLIANFESKTYFINLTLSLIDSLSNHLSELQFAKDIPNEVLVPLRLLFERGYLCEEIPYENNLKLKEEANINSSDYNEDDYVLDYITPSSILSKNDVSSILKIVMNYLVASENDDFGEVGKQIEIIDSSLDLISNLSILDGSRSSEFDGVFMRLYSYLENVYLGGKSDNAFINDDIEEGYYISGRYNSIHWQEELSSLLDVISDGYKLYDEIYTDDLEGIDILLKFFEPKYKDRTDRITNAISSSRLAGELISTSYIVDFLSSFISDITPNGSYPSYMSYANIYDNDGHFVDYGEVYYLFRALKFIGNDEKSTDFIRKMAEGNIGTDEGEEILNTLVYIVEKNVDNELGADILADSILLDAILSNFLIENGNISDMVSIYIDDSIKELDIDGNVTNIIYQDEIRSLFHKLPLFVEIAKPLLEGNELTQEDYIDLLTDERVYDLLDSKIIEGTVSDIVLKNFDNSGVVKMPSNIDKVSHDDVKGDIKKLIDINNTLGIDFKKLINAGDGAVGEIFEIFKSLTSDDIDVLLSSNILYYSMSDYFINADDSLFGDMDLIIPKMARVELDDTRIKEAIRKEILREFISDINLLAVSEHIDVNLLLANVVINKEVMDNFIISATVSNAIVNGSDSSLYSLRENLIIPIEFDAEHHGNRENIVEYYGISNSWYSESRALIYGLNLVLGLKTGDLLDPEEIGNKVKSNINSLNEYIPGTNVTKVDRIYDSDILIATLTKQIDDKLGPEKIDQEILESAKVQLDSNNMIYKKIELKNLVDTISILKIDFDNLDADDDLEKRIRENYDNDDIYKSKIVRGVITKKIDDEITGDQFVKTDLAYEDGLKLYRSSELKAVISITKNKQKIVDFSPEDVENLDVMDLLDYIYNDGYTESYLLVSTISSKIMESNDELIIPSSSYDSKNETIRPLELKFLIEGYKEMGGSTVIKDIGFEGEFSFENINDYSVIARSEIFRATITSKLKFNNEEIYVENDKEYASIKYDIDNHRITVLSEKELTNIISIVTGTNYIADINDLLNASDREVKFNSSIMRVFICQSLQDDIKLLPIGKTKEIISLCEINDKIEKEKIKMLSKEELLASIEILLAFI